MQLKQATRHYQDSNQKAPDCMTRPAQHAVVQVPILDEPMGIHPSALSFSVGRTQHFIDPHREIAISIPSLQWKE